MIDPSVYTCANGLTLIVQEKRDMPVVAIHVGVETGSALEGEYEGSGISHLLEHMVFKGTEEYSAEDLNEKVAALGGVWNAYTSSASTVFHIHGAAENWTQFLHILLQLVFKPVFPEEEWESEREVIRREMEMCDDDPDDVAYRALMETLYTLHPRRLPVIGTRAGFDALTRGDLRSYHSSRYVPGNAFVCVVGDVDTLQVQSVLEEECRVIPQSIRRERNASPEEPRQWGNRVSRREFPRSTSYEALAWRVPERNHPDSAALSMLSAILGNGRTAWLYREYHDTRSLVHEVGALLVAHSGGEGAFVVEADVDFERRDEWRDELLRYIETLSEADFDEALQREKKRYRVELLRQQTSVGRIAGMLCSIWPHHHNVHASREWSEAFMRVTAQDLQRVARLYLGRERITEVSVDPIGAVSGRQQKVSVERRARTYETATAGGLRCVLQSDDGQELVHIIFAAGAGSRVEDAAHGGASNLLAELMPKGTTSRSAAEIAALVENAGASLSSRSGDNSIALSIRCLPEDAHQMLNLLADIALHPLLEEQAVRTAKEDQLAALREDEQNPGTLACRRALSSCYGEDGYGHGADGTPESVAGLTREDLLMLHRRVFCAKNAVLSIAGCLDEQMVENWIKESDFSSLPEGDPVTHSATPQFTGGEYEVRTPEAAQQAAVALAVPTVPIGHRDMPLELLLESWCMDMSGPLYKELREKKGLVYSVGVQRMIGVDAGCLILLPETSPELLQDTKHALEETLDGLAVRGITQEELETTRAMVINTHLLSTQSLEKINVTMALDALLENDIAATPKLIDAVRGVTLPQMQAYVRRIFSPQQQRCSVRALPPEGK